MTKEIKKLESLMEVKCNMVSSISHLNDAFHSLKEAIYPMADTETVAYFDATDLRMKMYDIGDELREVIKDLTERQEKIKAEFTGTEVQEKKEEEE